MRIVVRHIMLRLPPNARRLVQISTLGAALLTFSGSAGAEAIQEREPKYWITHSVVTGSVLLGGAIAGAVWDDPLRPRWYPTRRLWAVSDALSSLNLILPVPALATGLNTNGFSHALFIYGEVLIGGYALNNLARSIEWKGGARGGTRAVIAFGAATVASHLFSEVQSASAPLVGAFWGVELGLATASTILHVAGTHPSQRSAPQALLEGMVGVALGMTAYKASYGRFSPMWQAPIWGALAGVVAGSAAGWALSSGSAVDAALVTFEISPFVAGAPGVSLGGTW